MWDAFQLAMKSAIDNCSVACHPHKVDVACRQRCYVRNKRLWKQWRRKPTDKNKARFIEASKHKMESINRFSVVKCRKCAV